MQSSRSRIILMLLLVASFWSWSFSYSEKDVADSASEICPILPGATVPDVNFRTLDGKSFRLKQAVSEKPTLLIFYRGGW